MLTKNNGYLLAAAVLNGLAALTHLACIAGGETWYRTMGAGEQMATLAAQGSSEPTVITLAISFILLLWTLFACSGAGVIRALPLLKTALTIITTIYLTRGIAGFYFISEPMGRTEAFWLWSSMICLGIGVVHCLGLRQLFKQSSSGVNN